MYADSRYFATEAERRVLPTVTWHLALEPLQSTSASLECAKDASYHSMSQDQSWGYARTHGATTPSATTAHSCSVPCAVGRDPRCSVQMHN